MPAKTFLHPDVKLVFSTRADGSMASGGGQPDTGPYSDNVDKFLLGNNFPLERSRVHVKYGDEQSYIKIERIDDASAGRDIMADALYTTEPGRVITLPVADCIATAVYDPVTSLLGVMHLGRHSSVAGLIEHFVLEVADNLGSDPRDWHVWMSPSLKKPSDRLDFFELSDTEEWKDYVDIDDTGIRIDTVGHNKARFMRAGVKGQNIIISPEDSYRDETYFSHRAAKELDDSSRQGRMLLAAYIS